jgi:hypothetical protein
MAFHVHWQLIGRHQRCLDSGEIDGGYDTYNDAAMAVSELLRPYPEATRAEDGSHWRARRSFDADLEIHIWIVAPETALGPETALASEAGPWRH